MTEDKTNSHQAGDLRRRAEEIARKKVAEMPEDLDALSPEAARRVLHELEVHQVELEMQNEELRRAQVELEATRARYFDLYDLAPVGYFTLSEKGLILEANLTAASLLGVARSALVKQPLSRFILSDDQDIYYRFRKRIHETGAPQVCELRIVSRKGSPFWARMETTAAQDGESEAPMCRAVMSDITARKQAEEGLQRAHNKLEQRVAEQTEELRQINEELRREITERKQAEEGLQKSLTLYRGLIETTGTGFVIIDQEGKVLDANQEYIRLSGHEDVSQIRGRSVMEWTADYEKERNTEAIGKCFREGQIRNLEIDYLNPQDKIIPIEINATVVKIDGAPQILTLCRDITERKRVEEELRKSEALLREAQASAHIGHWELDRSIMRPRWSEEIFHICGLDHEKDEPSFPMHQEITHPDDWHILNDAVTTLIAEGTPYDIEFRVLRPDKTIRWIHAIGYPKRDREARLKSIFGTAQDITERKQAELALRESERRFRDLYDSAPVGYHEYNSEGRITNVNRTDMEMLGYTTEEMIGQPVWNFNTEEVARERIMAKLNGTLPPDRNLERTYRKKDGTTIAVLCQDRLILDGQGKIQGIRCTIQDITELKRAEETVRETQENFRRSLDESPLGVRIVTAEGETLYANKAMLNIYGYDSIEELRTTPVNKRYTPESYAEYQTRKEKRERGGYVPTEYEISIVTKKGDIRHFQVFRKEVLWNNEKQFQTLYQDITERKRMADELRKSREFLNSILDNAPTPIYVNSTDNRYLLINKAWEEFVGKSREEVIGLSFEQVFSGETDRTFMKQNEYVLESGLPSVVEEQVSTPLGPLYFHTVRFPLIGADGRVESIGGISIDITARKRAEKEGEKLLEQLKLGRKRLQHLSQRLVELQETERRELARELHDKVGQSLTSLIINLKIIQNLLPEESGKSVSARIDDSRNLVEQTVICIRDVMARLRPPVLDDYGLRAALRWYDKQFMERTGIVMEVRGEEFNPRLPSQKETALFRIVQEALNNVAKHAKATRVTLTLESGEGKGRLTIADDGIGFDSRAHHQPGRRPEWGIINMRERAESIGGEFHIETAPGKGTKIIVEVPRKE